MLETEQLPHARFAEPNCLKDCQFVTAFHDDIDLWEVGNPAPVQIGMNGNRWSVWFATASLRSTVTRVFGSAWTHYEMYVSWKAFGTMAKLPGKSGNESIQQ